MQQRPSAGEYAPYFERYVSLVSEADVYTVLGGQSVDLNRNLSSIRAAMEVFRYAEGKWSVRQVVGHLIDAERVFAYRAFCISRGESAPLPSFDENAYVAQSEYHGSPLAELLTEFTLVRRSNLAFLARLTDEQLVRTGTASGKTISVRALAFIMAGHVRHHLMVLHERYGIPRA